MNLTCPIPNHKNSQIMMTCINQYCKSSKLLCQACIQQDLHIGHNKDLISQQDLSDFLKIKYQDCESFVNSLQKQMDSCLEILNSIKCGIRQKYSIEEGRQYNLNYQQINQAITEILRFNDIKQSIGQDITEGILNFNKVLNNIYSQLKLDLLSYRTISQQDQKKAKQLYNEGLILKCNHCQFEEAIQKFDQSLVLNPYDPDSLECKGECLKLLSKYNEALPWLDRALEINSKHVNSLWCKGDCLRMLKKYNEALTWLDKALEIDSKHVQSLYNKGDCLRMLNKYDEALTWLDKALTINPNHGISLGSKAQILKEQKKYKEAIIFFDRALVQYPAWQPNIDGKKYCQEQLEIEQ